VINVEDVMFASIGN